MSTSATPRPARERRVALALAALGVTLLSALGGPSPAEAAPAGRSAPAVDDQPRPVVALCGLDGHHGLENLTAPSWWDRVRAGDFSEDVFELDGVTVVY